MLDFQRPQLSQKDDYERVLFSCPPRGCEYSFANLYLWGRQQLAFFPISMAGASTPTPSATGIGAP